MIYIAFLFFTFLVLAFAFYQWQHFMIFSPTYHRDSDLGSECEILSLTTDDGVELEGVVYEPKNFTNTILFFAGRSHDAVGLIKKLSFNYPNVRIITFNYRSYGRSGGTISEKNILSDALFIAQIIQKNYGDFYVFGYSLGSNIASYVASKKSSLGVFLVGSFDSIASIAKEKFVNRGSFPMMNLSSIFRYKLRTREYVENIDAKVYIFVSKSDETTYIQNARNLKNHVKNLAYYEELDNLSHKELLWDSKVIDTINGVLK
ncbi:MAG: alpha/beta hydrolase [Sulfurimonas sp.]|nr:alpha/beta hydrolase [Sulfurimonas sp.]